MHKILVISDTHGNVLKINKLIKQNKYDYIIHLGDHDSDLNLIEFDDSISVKGNNDINSNNELDKIIDLFGFRFFITHGHKYNIYFTFDKLYYKALEEKADIVLFGHTHRPSKTVENGIIFLNPGSVSNPRNTVNGTYAEITIEQNEIMGMDIKECI